LRNALSPFKNIWKLHIYIIFKEIKIWESCISPSGILLRKNIYPKYGEILIKIVSINWKTYSFQHQYCIIRIFNKLYRCLYGWNSEENNNLSNTPQINSINKIKKFQKVLKIKSQKFKNCLILRKWEKSGGKKFEIF